jgi:hypothetical protein
MKTYSQLMEDVAAVTNTSYSGGGRGNYGMPSRPAYMSQSLSAGADSYDSKTTAAPTPNRTGLDFRGMIDNSMSYVQNNPGIVGGVAAAGIGAAFLRPALNTIGKIFGKKDPKPQDTFQKDYDDKRQITKDNVKNSMQTAKAVTSQKPKKIGGNRRTDNKPGAGVSAPLTKLG